MRQFQRIDQGLHFWMAERRLTQKKLGQRMGVTRQYAYKLVHGCGITTRTMLRACAALEVTPEQLLWAHSEPRFEIFNDPIVREIGRKLPLRRWKKNAIVRFIDSCNILSVKDVK